MPPTTTTASGFCTCEPMPDEIAAGRRPTPAITQVISSGRICGSPGEWRPNAGTRPLSRVGTQPAKLLIIARNYFDARLTMLAYNLGLHRRAKPHTCADPSSKESEMSVRHAKLFNQSALILAACAAFAFGASRTARAADAEAVTIDTTFIVKTPPVRLDKPARKARASVVLMSGGNGLLSLDSTGTITDSTGNFLIRSADLFLRHGLNVMMADTTPAHPGGLTLGVRLSATHAA